MDRRSGRSWASRAPSSARLLIPSFRYTRVRWASTVLGLMNASSATAFTVRPSARSPAIRRSVGREVDGAAGRRVDAVELRRRPGREASRPRGRRKVSSSLGQRRRGPPASAGAAVEPALDEAEPGPVERAARPARTPQCRPRPPASAPSRSPSAGPQHRPRSAPPDRARTAGRAGATAPRSSSRCASASSISPDRDQRLEVVAHEPAPARLDQARSRGRCRSTARGAPAAPAGSPSIALTSRAGHGRSPRSTASPSARPRRGAPRPAPRPRARHPGGPRRARG